MTHKRNKLSDELVDRALSFPSLLYSSSHMFMPGYAIEIWKKQNPDRVHELQNLKSEDFENGRPVEVSMDEDAPKMVSKQLEKR